jgi:hypothetical protein
MINTQRKIITYIALNFFSLFTVQILTLDVLGAETRCNKLYSKINQTICDRLFYYLDYFDLSRFFKSDGFGGLVVSMLASGTQGRGFNVRT